MAIEVPKIDPITKAILEPKTNAAISKKVADDITAGNTPVATALNAASAEKVAEVAIQSTVEKFGATGAGDDTNAIEAALVWATGGPGRKLVGTSGKRYRITRNIPLPAGNVDVDFQGATLEFATGGAITSGFPSAYLTTTSAAGIKRRGSWVTVADVTGVEIGDLVSISSPVEWNTGIPLNQHYLVSDVDAATKQVWVEGRIVGDITPAQIVMAGKTGDVTVRFYKLNHRARFANATITSPSRDAASSMVTLNGYRYVLVENVDVHRPNRTGVRSQRCGVVEWRGCKTTEHGYVTKDEGYANLAHHHQGMGYGYGFLATDCFVAAAQSCMSFSGWHGIDVAGGVTYAFFTDYTAFKDAYGISSHEGNWVLDVQGGRLMGGMGITCRSSELYVDGTRIDTSLQNGITGQGNLQRLVLRNLTIDAADAKGGGASPLWVTGAGYPDATRSAEAPYAEISNVTITGARSYSEVTVAGDLIIDGLRYSGGPDGDPRDVNIHSNGGGRLDLKNATFKGAQGQSNVKVTGFTTIDVDNAKRYGPTGTPSNSALMYLSSATATPYVRFSRCTVENMALLCRMTSGTATFDFFDNTVPNGRLVNASDPSVVKNAINNRTNNATLTLGTIAAPTQAVGNVVLTP